MMSLIILRTLFENYHYKSMYCDKVLFKKNSIDLKPLKNKGALKSAPVFIKVIEKYSTTKISACHFSDIFYYFCSNFF